MAPRRLKRGFYISISPLESIEKLIPTYPRALASASPPWLRPRGLRVLLPVPLVDDRDGHRLFGLLTVSEGITNVKALPWFPGPVRFVAQITPPCASTIFLLMKSPSPVPLDELVANFENRTG